MKLASMKALLSKLGIAENTWVVPKNLHKIIIDGDANLHTHLESTGVGICDNNHLYFDTTNQLLKIKKYTAPKVMSCRFNKNCTPHASYIEVPSVSMWFKKMVYPGMTINGKRPIPEPAVGDIVFTVNPATLKQTGESVYISKIEYSQDQKVCKIFFDEVLDVEGMILAWCTGGISQFNICEPAEADESILLYSEPVTSREFDVILDFAHIGGIELLRKQWNE